MADLESKTQENMPAPNPLWLIGGAVVGGVVTSLITGEIGYSGVGAYLGLCVGAGFAGIVESKYYK